MAVQLKSTGEIIDIDVDWDTLDPISQEIHNLEDQKAFLDAQIENLQRWDKEDPYEDGTAIIWHVQPGNSAFLAHQAAVREDGKWYVTGEMRAVTWSTLVVDHLCGHVSAQHEVITPSSAEEVVEAAACE